MKLIEFSVTNYRSVTTAHKISMDKLTVLVGKNNEGKSNILSALNVSMRAVMFHSKIGAISSRFRSISNQLRKELSGVDYIWERDFPIQYQGRKSGLESIFRLQFKLEESELAEFHSLTRIRGNNIIPISVRIGKDNEPKVEVPKRGSGSYNEKSAVITEFISERIEINYIQAVRTEKMAIYALNDVIRKGLLSLRNNSEYVEAINRVRQLQQEKLDEMSATLLKPLRAFLPSVKNVAIKLLDVEEEGGLTRDCIDIIIDDGVATSIRNKGDGIKNLATLALLKDKKMAAGASVIAIEEPESHLHAGAIHGLVDVINKLSENNQVIITTHNSAFVQQNKIESNVLVNCGTARSAKNLAEIRTILGIWPSDNLQNARFILLVEGENDANALGKILPCYSRIISEALRNNTIVIKPMRGVRNLAHDLDEYKRCMCKCIVLLDNDQAGSAAGKSAIDNGLATEAEIKYTIVPGAKESEFEDCLNWMVYWDFLRNGLGIDVKCKEFKGNEKWSKRMNRVAQFQGVRWTEDLEAKVKQAIVQSIPEHINNIDDVVVSEKAGFLRSLVVSLERLVSE